MATELGARGAHVIVLGREGARAASGGNHAFEHVDLASLESIAAFAARWGGKPIHMLMNVAGVMAVPTFTRTVDGFETHMGTNSLGHFALTGRLLPALPPLARDERARDRLWRLAESLTGVTFA